MTTSHFEKATINWEDGWLRLYFSDRIPKEEYKALREQGFKNRRGETTFKASFSASRVRFISDTYGIDELEDDDTDLQAEAKARSQTYQGRSSNAHDRYKTHHGAASARAKAIPFGQPMMPDHHSYRRDVNYRNGIERTFRKAFEELGNAQYWKRRAESTIAYAEARLTPRAIANRITSLETDLRYYTRILEEHEASGEGDSYHAYNTRLWLWFVEGRLAFERALYEALDDDKKAADDTLDLEVGGAFFTFGKWHVIERVNKKTVSYRSGVLNLKEAKSRIQKRHYMDKATWEQASKIRGHQDHTWILRKHATPEDIERHERLEAQPPPYHETVTFETGGAILIRHYKLWVEIVRVNPKSLSYEIGSRRATQDKAVVREGEYLTPDEWLTADKQPGRLAHTWIVN